MSERNVEIVRTFTRLFESGDRESWRHWFHPDIEWDIRGSDMPTAKLYRGHEGVVEFFRDWLAPWDDFRTESLEFVDAGDAIVVVFRQAGRGRGSGIEIERDFFGVYDLVEGKVKRFRLFESREDALAAAGLAPG